MKTRITDFVKKLFKRRKQQPFRQPERQDVPQKEGRAFQPERKKPPSRWIITHNRIIREHTNQIRKRRKKNKMGRQSRQINRRIAA